MLQKVKGYRWPIDPTLKRKPGGLPPNGHRNRCQGTERSGNQCQQWAKKGRLYCKCHGGNLPVFEGARSVRNFYSKNAGDKLRKVLEAVVEDSDDRMNLAGEIDLARVMCLRYMRIYEAAVIEDKDEKASADLKAMATTGLRASLNHVSGLVAQAARVDALRSTAGSPEAVEYIIHQVSRIVSELIGKEDEALASKVLDAIAEIRVVGTDGPSVTIGV